MLTTAQIDSMRATLEASLPDTASIERFTLIDDGMGGGSQSWAVVATAPVRMEQTENQGSEDTIGGHTSSRVLWQATFPELLDVSARDRILVGSRRFEVLSVMTLGSWTLATRALCTELL